MQKLQAIKTAGVGHHLCCNSLQQSTLRSWMQTSRHMALRRPGN